MYPATIEQLQQYRMSFVNTACEGEYLINGLILERCLPHEEWKQTKKEINTVMITAIDRCIDQLTKKV